MAALNAPEVGDASAARTRGNWMAASMGGHDEKGEKRFEPRFTLAGDDKRSYFDSGNTTRMCSSRSCFSEASLGAFIIKSSAC